MGPFWALFCHFWSIQQQFSCRFHFFGPIKVNFRPISNYRDTPNTFSVLTIFETPCFAIFPNFAVFCKKKNKKKHIWLFFPNKKLTITDVSSHFQGFLTFRLIFSIKEVNIWAIFPDLSPKLFFLLLFLCVCFQQRLFSSSGPF